MFAEPEIMVRTWLGETSSCSCKICLPGPAWILLNKICIIPLSPIDFLREDVTLLNYKGEEWNKYEAALLIEEVSSY